MVNRCFRKQRDDWNSWFNLMSDLVNRPKQDRGWETQERILKACRRLLKKKSFDAISVRQLVREAETSIGSFYARFRDKDALLPVLYGQYDQQLADKIEQLKTDAANARSLDEIAQLTVQHFITTLEIPNLSRALYEYVTRNPNSKESRALAKKRADQYDFLNDALLRFRNEISHSDPKRAIELAIYFVAMTSRNRLLYPQAPHTRTMQISIDELNRELTILFTGYLSNGK